MCFSSPSLPKSTIDFEMEPLAKLTIDGKTVYLSGGNDFNDYCRAASLMIAASACISNFAI
jgi:hypothetical protein